MKFPRFKSLHVVLGVFDGGEPLPGTVGVVAKSLGVGVDTAFGVPVAADYLFLTLLFAEDQVLPPVNGLSVNAH